MIPKRQEQLIKESAIDWTIAPPGVLTGGPHTGRYQVVGQSSKWRNRTILRSNVREFLVRQIEDQTKLYEAPVLAN